MKLSPPSLKSLEPLSFSDSDSESESDADSESSAGTARRLAVEVASPLFIFLLFAFTFVFDFAIDLPEEPPSSSLLSPSSSSSSSSHMLLLLPDSALVLARLGLRQSRVPRPETAVLAAALRWVSWSGPHVRLAVPGTLAPACNESEDPLPVTGSTGAARATLSLSIPPPLSLPSSSSSSSDDEDSLSTAARRLNADCGTCGPLPDTGLRQEHLDSRRRCRPPLPGV